MAKGNAEKEVPVEELPVERARTGASVRRLVNSAVRLSLGIAALPVNILPEKSRGHMKSAGRNLHLAGRDATKGVAALLHFVADNLEDVAAPK